MKWVLGLVLGAVLGGVLVDATLDLPHEVGRLEQPSTIAYADGSKHYLGLVERRSMLFGRVESHQLYVGRDPGMSYGHFVAVDSTGSRPVLAGAAWERDGVRVRFASGHSLFVPARNFMYGR